MTTVEHAQSLAEFVENAAETFERLKHSTEPEVITVDGEVRAILVSPAVYEDMAKRFLLNRDVEVIRVALQEVKEGKSRPVDVCFDEIRSKLLAMKAAQEKGASR
jgi:primosomal protein N''